MTILLSRFFGCLWGLFLLAMGTGGLPYLVCGAMQNLCLFLLDVCG